MARIEHKWSPQSKLSDEIRIHELGLERRLEDLESGQRVNETMIYVIVDEHC